jgi:hypothetical protein
MLCQRKHVEPFGNGCLNNIIERVLRMAAELS